MQYTIRYFRLDRNKNWLENNRLKRIQMYLMNKLVKALLRAVLPQAAALVWVLGWISVTAAASSCSVIVFCLLLFDRRDASELTSLSRTVVGKENRLARKSPPFRPTGATYSRNSSCQDAKLAQPLNEPWHLTPSLYWPACGLCRGA